MRSKLSAFLVSLLLFAGGVNAGCHAKCMTCFIENDENSCMSCDQTFAWPSTNTGAVLMGYVCRDRSVTTCSTSGQVSPCDCGYKEDARDAICKNTAHKVQNPCPPSTYNTFKSQTSVASCTACTAGQACMSWAAPSATDSCDAGFYCAAGSSVISPVIALGATKTSGTTILDWVMTEASTTTGHNKYLLNSMGDICRMGYFCVAGTTSSVVPGVGTPCPGGYFCPDDFQKADDNSADKQCSKGFYCTAAATKPTPGNFWRQQEDNVLVNNPSVDTAFGSYCKLGTYCLRGSTSETDCSAGTFGPATHQFDAAHCQDCPAGKYCENTGLSAPTADCTQGYFCKSASATATQTRCSSDHYCETGTVTMKPCPIGDYTSGTGASVCTDCPDGKYCSGYGGQIPCEVGYWCADDKKSPCPAGTYSELTMNTAVSSCNSAVCPTGHACYPVNVKVPCSGGYVCDNTVTGAFTAKPNTDAQGGRMCIPGYYCQSESVTPTTCGKGYYCANYATQAPTGQCWAGFKCLGVNAVVPGCTGAATCGGVDMRCDPGYYCPLGATDQTKCAVGTYNPSKGAGSSTDCRKCPSGFVCDTEAKTSLVILDDFVCSAGYYCPSGSDVNTETPCAEGYECKANSNHQSWCEAGTYQNLPQQSTCKQCEEGNFCDGINNKAMQTCPQGCYCLASTKYSCETPCPPGSYGGTSGLKVSTECTKCNGGYYCQHYGLTSMTTLTLARYHQNSVVGQVIPDPFLCPIAHYCPEGSFQAIPCDNGKWTTSRGASSSDYCTPCERGKWCKFTDMAADVSFQTWMNQGTVTSSSNGDFDLTKLLTFPNLATYYGDCSPGYICLEGATSSTPASVATAGGYPCPMGHFCEPGDIIEQPCLPGTYQPAEQKASCDACLASFRCPKFGMLVGEACEIGSYCPGGDIDGIPCPAGKYAAPLSSSSPSQCLACPETKYCDIPGLINPTDICSAGFVCVEGSDRPGPYATQFSPLTTNGYCPVGKYCEAGQEDDSASSKPPTCIAGYVQESTQGTKCDKCAPGYYCTGGSSPKIKCDAGHVCTGLAKVKAPTDSTGYTCPVSNFCPAGTGQEYPCYDGTFQNITGQSTCQNCPAGYMCQQNSMKLCPAYRICDYNTTTTLSTELFIYGHLCNNGFYTENAEGMSSTSNCTSCSPTFYCMASQRVDHCAPGYICVTEADTHKPNITSKAYPCPLGYYCPEGAEAPIRCPMKTYTFEEAGKQVSECTICKMGWYCNYDQLEPKECPQGAYCPIGSMEPKYCPRGTYQPAYQKGNLKDCLPCRGGYTCPERGVGNLLKFGDRWKCPGGHYCPRGTDLKPIGCIAGSFLNPSASEQSYDFDQAFIGGISNADSIKDCQLCPEHFFCPAQTAQPWDNLCPAGFLCPPGSGEPIACPPGYFCPRQGQTTVQVTCPRNHYCPIATAVPHLCKANSVCRKGSASENAQQRRPCDCKRGKYLNVNMCLPCVPGFVCRKCTNQKYPVYFLQDGGYECPKGHYCPGGAHKEIKCPKGTYRMETRGEKKSDCAWCPEGSAQDQKGQAQCFKCGRGAKQSANRQLCECIGRFRSWQISTNECVCRRGWYENQITQAKLTSTENLDCQPVMKPVCGLLQFIDIDNKCQWKSICKTDKYCDGKGGEWDDGLKSCACKGENDPDQFCDVRCQKRVLRAFMLRSGKILLVAGAQRKVYPISAFGDRLYMEGVKCKKRMCEISSLSTVDGKQKGTYEANPIFVDVWLKSGKRYQSPYPQAAKARTDRLAKEKLDKELAKIADNAAKLKRAQDGQKNGRRLLEGNNTVILSGNSTNPRILQERFTEPKFTDGVIKCIKTYDSLTFSIDKEKKNYPVYIPESQYNSDDNYDYGLFTKLQTKILKTDLQISTFLVSFNYIGVFVFGESNDPMTAQTIVKVVANNTEKKEACSSTTNWPLTSDNLKALGIKPNYRELSRFGGWTHLITPFFLVIAFAAVIGQAFFEAKVDKLDEERMSRKQGISRKYFKKKANKFDKLDYLADLYKLIEDNLNELQKQIEENDRLEREQDAENMRKMVKNKYSLMNALSKKGATGRADLAIIQANMQELLDNMKFADGRSLREVMEAKRLQKEADLEEARLRELEEQASQHDSEPAVGSGDDSFQSQDDVASSHSRGSRRSVRFGGQDHEEEEDNNLGLNLNDPGLMDDLLKAKEELARKRAAFVSSMDDGLGEDEKAALLAKFDEQMRDMERSLMKQQEDQDMLLKNKLLMRKKKRKEAQTAVNIVNKDKQDAIAQIQDDIQKMQIEHDELGDNDINTRDKKKERDREFKERMAEFDQDRDLKVNNIRSDYMKRIDGIKSLAEKERLLEEMGKRLKGVEDQFDEEKRRQEANLMKMLKERQKKQIKKKGQDLAKEIDKMEEKIDDIQQDIDVEKAKIYADQGTDNLVDQAVLQRKNRVADKAISKEGGFKNELSEVEKEDMAIHQGQQQIEKDKILKIADAAIEEEIEAENKKHELDLQDEASMLRRQIQGEDDPEEKARLLQELNKSEKLIQMNRDNDRMAQDRMLKEKLARKKHLLAIRKLKIERDQLKDTNDKEVEINQKKFDEQIGRIDKVGEEELGKQLRQTMTRGVTGNEKGLILADQAFDELQARKLKILMSKQFFELSKHLGTMQSQIALERMIANKEIEAQNDREKDKLINTLRGTELDDALAKLHAKKQLELSLVDDKLHQSQLEQDSEIRQKCEAQFGEEKKEMQRHCQRLKKQKIQDLMGEFSEEPLILDVGSRMIERIDDSQKAALREIDEQTDKKLEEARLRIVAENEEELAALQQNLDEAMEKEAAKVEALMNKQRDEVLARKKDNMEARMKMVTGDMTDQQIKELRAQLEREYNALEKAIADEKHAQLQKMRGAMLKRRIAKEQKRKKDLREKEEEARRKNITKMNAGLAKAFTTMIKKKQEADKEVHMRKSTIANAESKLRAKLISWKKDVDQRHLVDAQEDIWDRETPEEERARLAVNEDDIKAKADADAAQAAKKGVDYTITELYKRVLKVEKLSDKVKVLNNVGGQSTYKKNKAAKIADLQQALKEK